MQEIKLPNIGINQSSVLMPEINTKKLIIFDPFTKKQQPVHLNFKIEGSSRLARYMDRVYIVSTGETRQDNYEINSQL